MVCESALFFVKKAGMSLPYSHVHIFFVSLISTYLIKKESKAEYRDFVQFVVTHRKNGSFVYGYLIDKKLKK